MELYVEGSSDGQDQEYIALLRSSSQRWKTAYIDMELDKSTLARYSFLFDHAPTSFPQLQALVLLANQEQRSELSSTDIFPSIFNTPSLRRVVTNAWFNEWKLPVSWVHLIDLDLDHTDVHPPEVLQILRACPNLITFTFSNVYHEYRYDETIVPWNFAVPPVILSQLQSLYVNTLEVAPLLLASHLEAPALFNLTLMSSDGSDWAEEQEEESPLALEAQRYVARFGMQLTRVEVHYWVLEESAMLGILGGLVNVEELTVSAIADALTCHVLARLTPGVVECSKCGPHGGEELCTKLRFLDLTIMKGESRDVEERTRSALALIEGRATRGIQLVRITDDGWDIVRPKGQDSRNAEWEERFLSKVERESFDQMDENKKWLDRCIGGSRLLGISVEKRKSGREALVRHGTVLLGLEHTLVYRSPL